MTFIYYSKLINEFEIILLDCSILAEDGNDITTSSVEDTEPAIDSSEGTFIFCH